MLTDQSGTTYDFLSEPNYRGRGISLDGKTDENINLNQAIRQACQDGEGLRVEFKPFVDIDGKKRNDKLNEIHRTLVALANTSGGRIILGVNDACEIEGINHRLSKWVKGAADAEACNKYLGALRARVCDVVVGEPEVTYRQAIVDGHLVAVIEVSEAREKPMYIRDDNHLYVRRGSNNSKAPPDQWKTVLGCNTGPQSIL